MSKTGEAFSACVNNMTITLDDKYFVVVLLILFYITSQQSYELIKNISGCSNLISRDSYDGFISSIVFWIISLILFIFIKFNGVNTLNSFQFKALSDPKVGLQMNGPDLNGIILRSQYITQSVLSIGTNIFNVSYVILLIYTLYKIIDTFISLIECKAEYCDKKSTILQNASCTGIDESKMKFFDPKSTECFDEDGNVLKADKTPKTKSAVDDMNASTSTVSIYDKGLIHDFQPPLIKYFLETWSPIGGDMVFKTYGMIITGISLIIMLTLYIALGSTNKKILYGGEIIMIWVAVNMFSMIVRTIFNPTVPIDDTDTYLDYVLKLLQGLIGFILFFKFIHKLFNE